MPIKKGDRLILKQNGRDTPVVAVVLPQSEQELAFGRVSGNTLAEECL
jgi:hypothetical protein